MRNLFTGGSGTAGRHAVRMGSDGWSIYSQDGSLAAHFEFTVAVTAHGPWILCDPYPYAAEQGAELTIRGQGEDAEEAVAAIVALIERGFDDEEPG